MQLKAVSSFIISIVLATAINLFAGQADCGFIKDLKDSTGMSCGFLEVPENHDRPSAREIKIAYVLIRTASKNPAPDPMIFFSGGPGGGSINAGFMGFLKNSPIGKQRDIVVFDQRGIGFSSPLPDIGLEVFDAMAADTDINGERKLIAQTLRKYRDLAKKEGINLGDYNTFQNAKDVGALMVSLGYKKYNLFGISYGTRLARTIQDLFPGRINTVVLDSPNLMTEDFLIDRMKGYSAAVGKVIDGCANDKECHQRFPKLAADYVDVVKALEKKSIPIKYEGSVFYLNSQDAVYFLRRQLYSNNAKKLFPEFVYALKGGNEEVIRKAILVERKSLTDGGFNSSMFLAVSAFESMNPDNTERSINETYNKLPYFPAQLGFFTSLYLERMNWHGKMLPLDRRSFNRSVIPTMIFVNQYDPVTPPENGALFQKKLASSHLFILDEGGHSGGDFNCKMKVMVQFMNKPKSNPDSSCLKLFKRDEASIGNS
jgi:pimeloyl-ACP methyl ester carboxylesterase